MIFYTQLIYGQKGEVASTVLDTLNVHIFSGYPFLIWTHNFIHNYMLQFFNDFIYPANLRTKRGSSQYFLGHFKCPYFKWLQNKTHFQFGHIISFIIICYSFFMFYKYTQLIYGQKGGVASTFLDTSNVHIFSGYKIKPSYNLDT